MTQQQLIDRIKDIEVLKITGQLTDRQELDSYRELSREALFGTYEMMEAAYDRAWGLPTNAIRLMLN